MGPIRWWMTWHEPKDDEFIAYVSIDRIKELSPIHASDIQKIDQGIQVLLRWCRLHCKNVPLPVNVRGKTGFAFQDNKDAILFKLTWGG